MCDTRASFQFNLPFAEASEAAISFRNLQSDLSDEAPTQPRCELNPDNAIRIVKNNALIILIALQPY